MKIARKSVHPLRFILSKKIATTLLVILFGIFVVANAGAYAVFLHRTYPNTIVDNQSLKSISFTQLSTKLNSLHLLPSKLTLSPTGGQRVVVATNAIGVQIDTTEMVQSAQTRSRLPILNFLKPHKVNLALHINDAVLENKLTQIANEQRRNPVNASITVSSGSFIATNASEGTEIDIPKAEKVIIAGLQSDKSSITLPAVPIAPTIRTSALASAVASLKAQLATPINYTYGGKTTTASTTEIASWYTKANNTYTIQNSKIQAYLTQVGSTYGIHVQNLAAGVTATVTALQNQKPLSFALTAAPAATAGPCSSSSLQKLILVSISQRHLWACVGSTQLYDSAVVTGMDFLAADLTPTGTYHIYSKQTNLNLDGSDSTGSWHDYVNYWMPFLNNQYGEYGLHDATWRSPSDFGNISPDSSNASHGCVELPLATAAWIYNWAAIGTTVTIES